MTTGEELTSIMKKLIRDRSPDVMIVGRPNLGRVTEWLKGWGIDSSEIRTWFNDEDVHDVDLCIVTAIDDWRRLKLYCTDRHDFEAIKEWDTNPDQLVFILKDELRTLRLVDLDKL